MAEERSKEIILGQFLEGLNQAVGGGRHMIHHHQDSRWFQMVAIWETVMKMCVNNVVDPLLTPTVKEVEKKLITGYEPPSEPVPEFNPLPYEPPEAPVAQLEIPA